MSETRLKVNNPEITSLNIITGIVLLIPSFLFYQFGTFLLEESLILFSIFSFTISVIITFFAINKGFQKEGIEFDSAQNTFRLYKKNIIKDKGDWKQLSEYSSLVILSKNGKLTLGQNDLTASYPEVDLKVMIYELYLMKKRHVKRQYIVNYKTHEQILELALKIEKLTDLKLEIYNPVTARRRRR